MDVEGDGDGKCRKYVSFFILCISLTFIMFSFILYPLSTAFLSFSMIFIHPLNTVFLSFSKFFIHLLSFKISPSFCSFTVCFVCWWISLLYLILLPFVLISTVSFLSLFLDISSGRRFICHTTINTTKPRG